MSVRLNNRDRMVQDSPPFSPTRPCFSSEITMRIGAFGTQIADFTFTFYVLLLFYFEIECGLCGGKTQRERESNNPRTCNCSDSSVPPQTEFHRRGGKNHSLWLAPSNTVHQQRGVVEQQVQRPVLAKTCSCYSRQTQRGHHHLVVSRSEDRRQECAVLVVQESKAGRRSTRLTTLSSQPKHPPSSATVHFIPLDLKIQ